MAYRGTNSVGMFCHDAMFIVLLAECTNSVGTNLLFLLEYCWNIYRTFACKETIEL